MTATFVDQEIVTQPDTWRRAAGLLPEVAAHLPDRNASVAVVGCGTSWFIAQAYAVRREELTGARTDAFAGSEFPLGRPYDLVIAISRSGTTTEIVDLLAAMTTPTLLITGVADSPAARAADAVIDLHFADERSVVQTRFATTTLALLRAHLGDDIEAAARDAELALVVDIEPYTAIDQVTYLGRGWTVGLAAEAALKVREAAQFWSESYPAMDYRHGPFSIAQPGRLVFALGEVPGGLADEVRATGATFVSTGLDPLAELIVAQRLAVALAEARGLDPDRPRSLTRSVVLDRA